MEKNDNMKLGWKIHETIGIGIVNPKLIKIFKHNWCRLYYYILKHKYNIKILGENLDGGFDAEITLPPEKYLFELKNGKEIRQKQ